MGFLYHPETVYRGAENGNYLILYYHAFREITTDNFENLQKI